MGSPSDMHVAFDRSHVIRMSPKEQGRQEELLPIIYRILHTRLVYVQHTRHWSEHGTTLEMHLLLVLIEGRTAASW